MTLIGIFSFVVTVLVLFWLGKTVFLAFLIVFAGLVSSIDAWWAVPASIILMLVVIFSFRIDEI